MLVNNNMLDSCILVIFNSLGFYSYQLITNKVSENTSKLISNTSFQKVHHFSYKASFSCNVSITKTRLYDQDDALSGSVYCGIACNVI